MTIFMTKLIRDGRWALIAGIGLLFAALSRGSWLLGVVAVGALVVVGRKIATRAAEIRILDEPWPWPPDFRALAEGLARPTDPTPKRLLPPEDTASMIAHVATTKAELTTLIADKPPAWPWTLFTSVLLQRRKAVQSRLRNVAAGYQPRAGTALSGQAYSRVARQAMLAIADTVGLIEQFMLSPAFKGSFGEVGNEASADPHAIVAVADRLMDYHEAFLTQAEACLQTPVERAAVVFVRDMGAFALSPLLGYEKFIATLCARVGEAQDLLPHTKAGTVVMLDDVGLEITVPEGLSERVVAQVRRFNE